VLLPGKKSNLRRKLSVKFWLLTPTRNQWLRLVMLKTILRRRRRRRKRRRRSRRRRRRRRSRRRRTTMTASLSRSQNTGCNK
jgi:hypothetical protein